MQPCVSSTVSLGVFRAQSTSRPPLPLPNQARKAARGRPYAMRVRALDLEESPPYPLAEQ